MGRTTTKSIFTYRGYSAKPQPTKSSYVPTRQATSSGGQSSSGDNSWAQRLLEEERRKQRIADNKVFIAQVKSANSEVKELREMISEAEGMLTNAVTGEQYAKYKQMLESQDTKLQQVGNELNAAGAEAAKNIQKDGEGYIYNNTNTNPGKSYTTKNKGTLSVDTNELRKLQALLEDIEEKSQSVETKVAKITSTSSEVGIKTGTNASDVKGTTNAVTQLKNNIEQQIRETEKTESENLSIIDKIAKWAGNLFKTDSDSINDKTTTTRTRTTTSITTSPTGTRTRTTTPSILEVKQTEKEQTLEELARIYGINTKGKNEREILLKIAESLGIYIDVYNPRTESRFWRNTMD